MVQIVHHALEQQHETERAGIDDVGLTHGFEAVAGTLERLAGRYQAPVQHGADVFGRFNGDARMHRAGCVCDDAQDRAVLRLGHRAARIFLADGERLGQLFARYPGGIGERIGNALQELCEDRTRVSARAIERRIGHHGHQIAAMVPLVRA